MCCGPNQRIPYLFSFVLAKCFTQNFIHHQKVAVQLLQTLKDGKLKMEHWKEKESTRDAVFTVIRDFLWDDTTGLPVDSYTEEEVTEISHRVFQHIFYAYPTVPSPIYESVY